MEVGFSNERQFHFFLFFIAIIFLCTELLVARVLLFWCPLVAEKDALVRFHRIDVHPAEDCAVGLRFDERLVGGVRNKELFKGAFFAL